MIYDQHGTPLRCKMGFLRGYTPVREERMEISAVGGQHIECEINTLDDTTMREESAAVLI